MSTTPKIKTKVDNKQCLLDKQKGVGMKNNFTFHAKQTQYRRPINGETALKIQGLTQSVHLRVFPDMDLILMT